MNTTPEDELRFLLKKYAYKKTKHEITLRSGLKTNTFVDTKQITLMPQGQKLLGDIFLKRIRGLNDDTISGIAAVATGASPIVSAISYHSFNRGKELPSLLVYNRDKKEPIEGPVHLFPNRANIVLIEDVTTTGNSTVTALEILRENGFTVKYVFTLVDREINSRKNIEKNNVKFISIYSLKDLEKTLYIP